MALPFLTQAEQRLLQALPNGVFSIDDVHVDAPRRYKLQLLNRLEKKFRLTRLSPGQFFLGPDSSENRLTMALALGPSGYLGFLSALKHYGLIEEELSRVQIATPHRRGLVDLGTFDVQLIPIGGDFYGIIPRGNLRVSTRAKTIYDCLSRPRCAGGISRVLSVLKRASFSKDDWFELSYYLSNSGNKSLMQRTGFWLSSIAPKWFLESLDSSIGNKAVVRIGHPSTPFFDSRWKVYHG